MPFGNGDDLEGLLRRQPRARLEFKFECLTCPACSTQLTVESNSADRVLGKCTMHTTLQRLVLHPV